MAEYDSARELCQRLIKKKGRKGVRLLQVGVGELAGVGFQLNFVMPQNYFVGSSEDVLDWRREAPPTDDVLIATVPAVFLSPNEARGAQGQFAFPVFSRSGASEDFDSLISEATYLVYVAAADLPEGLELSENAVGLLVESLGTRYSVLRAQTFKPGETEVLHILAVKG